MKPVYNMRYLLLGTFCWLVLSFLSCTTNYDDKPSPPSDTTSSNPVTGTLYIRVSDSIDKVDASGGQTLWSSLLLNTFGAGDFPIILDKDYYYHGNATGMTCYSKQTGEPKWSFDWLAFNDALAKRVPAFNDSLVFVTSPASVFDGAYLFCLSKVGGMQRWKQDIDNGSIDANFNTVPMVYNNEVIVVARDGSNGTYLKAFDINDGHVLWQSGNNQALYNDQPVLQNGKIYSGIGDAAFCYNAANGNLLWQTDLKTTGYQGTAVFADVDKLVIVKLSVNDANQNGTYLVSSLNLQTGSLAQSAPFTIAADAGFTFSQVVGCAYRSSKLYISSAVSADSISLLAFDVNAMHSSWTHTYQCGYGSTATPIATDKYLIFPVNTGAKMNQGPLSQMMFTDLTGKVVKKVPFTSSFSTSFSYVENNIAYQQAGFL